jgi:hypothetical protein
MNSMSTVQPNAQKLELVLLVELCHLLKHTYDYYSIQHKGPPTVTQLSE